MKLLDDNGLANKLWTLIKEKLSSKVDKTTKINGHPLSSDIAITTADLGLDTTLTAQASAIAEAKAVGTSAQTNLDTHIDDKSNPHEVSKSQIGLSNVTNDTQVKRSEMGAASGVATLDANSKVNQNIDASKITSGTISIDRLPKGALERLTVVANAAARKALTTNDVQNGDTVKETDTGLMYYVKDDTKLNQDAGWEVYTAGAASSVPWSGVTGKPNDFPNSSKLNVSGDNGTKEGVSALINKLEEATGDVTDETMLVTSHGTPSGNINYFRRNVSKLWNWIKSKGGSDSGLDADLLDGFHSTQFVRALYDSESTAGVNMNELVSNRSFIGSVSSTTNTPSGNGWYNVIQAAHRNGVGDGPSYVGQIALGMTVGQDNMWFRTHRTREWQKIAKAIDLGKLCYGYNAGHLVQTDIPAASNTMVIFRIVGNSYYDKKLPIDTTIQFYNYDLENTILSYSAINNGHDIGEIKAFNYNNHVCIWFAQSNNFQTYSIQCITPEGIRTLSITNVAMPTSGTSRLVTIYPNTSGLLLTQDMVEINVGGDANTYYPVLINREGFNKYPALLLNISRTYGDPAPNTWNNATHRGGLTACILWNGSCYWDGNGQGSNSVVKLLMLHQDYSTMFGGMSSSTYGLVVWLRGGGAVYYIHSGMGKYLKTTVYLSEFPDNAGNKFAPITTPRDYSAYKSLDVTVPNADKLTTNTVGSNVKPVYFHNGVPKECSYNLKDIPDDAVFTDTTYSKVSKNADGLCPKLPNETSTTKYLRQDGTWFEIPLASANSTTPGLMTPIDANILSQNNAILQVLCANTDWNKNIVNISYNSNNNTWDGSITMYKHEVVEGVSFPVPNKYMYPLKSLTSQQLSIICSNLLFLDKPTECLFVDESTNEIFRFNFDVFVSGNEPFATFVKKDLTYTPYREGPIVDMTVWLTLDTNVTLTVSINSTNQ